MTLSSELAKLNIKNYEEDRGHGNCYKCLSLRNWKRNMYTTGNARCSPLMLNLIGTQYEEWTWVNYVARARK